MEVGSQNHRMGEVGKHHRRSAKSNLPNKQGSLEQVTWDCVLVAFKHLQRRLFHNSILMVFITKEKTMCH